MTTAMPAARPMAEEATVQPSTIVLFGASGDLAHRMVVPALFRLWRRGQLGDPFRLIGYARTAMTDDAFREGLQKAVLAKAAPGDAEAWPEFAAALSYVSGQYEGDEAGYHKLEELLAKDDPSGVNRRRLYYLALPPKEFAPVVSALARCGLVKRGDATPEAWNRVVVEKPFGRDLASARALNEALSQDVDERDIYRIDHYLGKEAAQNLFTFRFGNGLFEPVWNRNHIEYVEITAAETLGVEGRGGYYETTGALRDMVQNHLMQLLALVAIEPPAIWTPSAVRNEKVKVLNAIRRFTPEEVDQFAVRGQYGPGEIGGKKLPGYREEDGVDPKSTTETYAALRLFVDNWRWAGVPFYLRSGKRLGSRHTEITIQFKPAPHTPFPVPNACGGANTLVVEFAPRERVTLRVAGKRPGRGMRVTPVELEYHGEAGQGNEAPPTAYENLLLDALVGDSTFFARADEVNASWEVIDPVLKRWASQTSPDFPNYASGSEGPEAAEALLIEKDRSWCT